MSVPHNDSSTVLSNPQQTHSIPNPIPTLFHVSFNQDFNCFAAGTNHGFSVFNCDPFREVFRREFGPNGGVGLVEMLFRFNIIAFVGGGNDPAYTINKVMIWDDDQSRCFGELSFRSEVKAVRLRVDRIVVVLKHKILAYKFDDLSLVNKIETIENGKGLCEISYNSGAMVLVCPGLQKGQVRVERYASGRTKYIMAHDSTIACLGLTKDGRLLATASSKGTLVRIFNTMDGSLLQEVRRGADRAEIHCLAFSPSAQWLAVSSDKGTVHVFNLKVDSGLLGHGVSQSTSESNSTGLSSLLSFSFIKGFEELLLNTELDCAFHAFHTELLLNNHAQVDNIPFHT